MQSIDKSQIKTTIELPKASVKRIMKINQEVPNIGSVCF